MAGVKELLPTVGTQAACEVLGLPRASYYRQQRPTFGPSKKAVSARALSLTERDTVLACLHEERFQDRSPAAVFATLLDEGVYHCSLRTMQRILEQEGETGERRDQLTHPAYQKPELLASNCSRHLWFITARRRQSSSDGRSCSTPPARRTRSVSCAQRLNYSPFQRRSGSTNPQKTKLSKFHSGVSQIY